MQQMRVHRRVGTWTCPQPAPTNTIDQIFLLPEFCDFELNFEYVTACPFMRVFCSPSLRRRLPACVHFLDVDYGRVEGRTMVFVKNLCTERHASMTGTHLARLDCGGGGNNRMHLTLMPWLSRLPVAVRAVPRLPPHVRMPSPCTRRISITQVAPRARRGAHGLDVRAGGGRPGALPMDTLVSGWHPHTGWRVSCGSFI